MLKELYPSDLQRVKQTLEQGREWLPFYVSKEYALNQLSAHILLMEDTRYVFGWYEKKKLIAVYDCQLSRKELVVTNFLVMSSSFSWSDFNYIIEQTGKKFRVESIHILIEKLSCYMSKQLEKIGFRYNVTYYEKSLCYHTGLVLGGGGAKGAYQIGAWRALRELGVDYDMISGTSVGALNGGLILQGDFGSAQKMWQTIDTQKILSVPITSLKTDFTLNGLLASVQTLALSAFKTMGVGTAPLLRMIEELVDETVIFDTGKEFYLVTTLAPKMEERVVSLSEMTEATFPKWLLASSSFFPAMQACLIDEQYYVDGGYRNNIPKDVLINKGVTELIVINVKGPGVTKPVKTPRFVHETTIESHWGLGNVLLFDGKRSSWNMLLGYLEAMKAFGHYEGDYYTFPRKHFKKEALNISRSFLNFIKKEKSIKAWYIKHYGGNEIEWLMTQQVVPELLSWTLLEAIARKFDVDPAHLYTLDELAEEVLRVFDHAKKRDNPYDETMLFSTGEWIKRYIRQSSPVSDRQWLMSYYDTMKEENPMHKEAYPVLVEHSLWLSLEALFLIYLEKRGR